MLSQQTPSRMIWTPWVLAIAGFWFSSNLVLDLLVMPVMYVSGMGGETDFAAAGYSLFWSFNRLELLCAAAILTGVLALRQRPPEFAVSDSGSRCRWALIFAVLLLSATLVDTYWLAPEMSAMAFALEGTARSALAPVMTGMHGCYWLLEVSKLVSLGGMAWLCLKDLRSPRAAYASAKLSA
ncbi:MAG: hypothetical protein AAGF98_10375 [Cyanobacteria bacterium P01_H01_bin.153]